MNDTSTLDYWINLARQMAIAAHNGQFLKDGKTPYINYVFVITNAVENRLKPIALLHDVVKNSKMTVEKLTAEGFDQYVIAAIDVLTHRSADPDIIYWNKILTNPDAIVVKLQEISYKLNNSPSPNDKLKYQRAIEIFASNGYSL